VSRFPVHTALTIATLGALLCALPRALPRVVPAFQGPRIDQLTSLAEFNPERTPLLPWRPHVTPEVVAPVLLKNHEFVPLLDDRDGVLDDFYAALWRTERKVPSAMTRILHYGDSPTTGDLITGDIRAQLQNQYGDAGHGFTLLAKPWAWYQHRGVSLDDSGWQILPATLPDLKDGLFGLGGVSLIAESPAHTQITWRDAGQSEFELFYLQQSEGGNVTVTSHGEILDEIHTAAAAKSPGFAAFQVPGGASELDLQSQGKVRLFGLTAERAGPGVVYDSIGLNGASITVLSRKFNRQHWTLELRERNPNLVVLNYGTNEADSASFVDTQYEKELREAIGRLQTALPDASILVMSPMDRGYRPRPGEIETMATIPRIVATQRRVARETGCGFFDTFTAMGGAGTMALWYNGQPRLVSADLIHPYPAGGKIIATIFVKQIEAGLSRYKLRQTTQSSASSAVR
jgi:lysophospholipase L1-like esterase